MSKICFLFFCGVLFSSCQKFENGKNFRLRSVKQILCKNEWKLTNSNFEGATSDYEFIEMFEIKFNKDGTCRYKVKIHRDEKDQSQPDYKPYQGFYIYDEDIEIESTWRFPTHDKSTFIIEMENTDVRFYMDFFDRRSMTVYNNVEGADVIEYMFFFNEKEYEKIQDELPG